jgi:sulfite exporter TauE/SafE
MWHFCKEKYNSLNPPLPLLRAFGLGRLPSLFLFDNTVHWLATKAGREMLRWAGFLVVFMVRYNLYQYIKLMSSLLQKII